MYSIYSKTGDKTVCLHDDRSADRRVKVINPNLKLVDSGAGSLSFKLPPDNIAYGKFQTTKETIKGIGVIGTQIDILSDPGLEQGTIDSSGTPQSSDKYLRTANYLTVDHQNGQTSADINIGDAIDTTQFNISEMINGAYLGKYPSKETITHTSYDKGYYDYTDKSNIQGGKKIDETSNKYLSTMFGWSEGLYTSYKNRPAGGTIRSIFRLNIVKSDPLNAKQIQFLYVIYGGGWGIATHSVKGPNMWRDLGEGNTEIITDIPDNMEAFGLSLRYSDGSALADGDIEKIELIDESNTPNMSFTWWDSNFESGTINIEKPGGKRTSSASRTDRIRALVDYGYFNDTDTITRFRLTAVLSSNATPNKTLQYKILQNADLAGKYKSTGDNYEDPDKWNSIGPSAGVIFEKKNGTKSFWVIFKYSDDSEIAPNHITSATYTYMGSKGDYIISSPYEDISGHGDELVIKTEFTPKTYDLTLQDNLEQGEIYSDQGDPTKRESDYHIRILVNWDNFAGIGYYGTFKLSLTKSDTLNQNKLQYAIFNAARNDGTGATGGDSNYYDYDETEGAINTFQHAQGARSFWIVLRYKADSTAITQSDISDISYRFVDDVSGAHPMYIGMAYSLFDENYQFIVDVNNREISNSIIHADLIQKVKVFKEEVIKVAKYIKLRYMYCIGESEEQYAVAPITVDLFQSFSYGIQSALQYYVCQYNDTKFLATTGPYRMQSDVSFADGCTKYKVLIHRADDADIDPSDMVSATLLKTKLLVDTSTEELDLVGRMSSTIIVKREIVQPSFLLLDTFEPASTTSLDGLFEQGGFTYVEHEGTQIQEKTDTNYAIRTKDFIPLKLPANGYLSIKVTGRDTTVDETVAANTATYKMYYKVFGYSSPNLDDLVYDDGQYAKESETVIHIPNDVTDISYIMVQLELKIGDQPTQTATENLVHAELIASCSTPTSIVDTIENGSYTWYSEDPNHYEIDSAFGLRVAPDKLLHGKAGSFPTGTMIRVSALAKTIDKSSTEELDYKVIFFGDVWDELTGYWLGAQLPDENGNVVIGDWLDNEATTIAIIFKRKGINWTDVQTSIDDHMHGAYKIDISDLLSADLYIMYPGHTGGLTRNDLDYSGNALDSNYTLCTDYLPLSNPPYATSAQIQLTTKQGYKMAWGIATYRLVSGEYEILNMYRWLNTNDRFDDIKDAPDAIRIFIKCDSPESIDEDLGPIYPEIVPIDVTSLNVKVQHVEFNRVEKEIWEGRVLSEDLDFQNNRVIYCEGELAYLNDTRVAPRVYNNVSFRNYISAIIDNHNSKVSAERRFTLGQTWEPAKKKSQNDYDRSDEEITTHVTNFETSLELLNQLVNDYGGHLRVRKDDYGTRIIDWLEDYPRISTQEIRFGTNLLDYTRKYDMSNLFTVLYPTGKVLVQAKSSAVGDHVSKDPSVWKRYENTLLYLDSTDSTNQKVRMNTGPKLAGYLTVVATVEPEKTYYFSSRLHGGFVAYCLYDGYNGTGNMHSKGIERAGSDTTPGFVDYVDQEITIPAGFHSIAMCCFGNAIPLALKEQTKEVEGIDKVVTIEEVASDVASDGKVWHTKGSPYIMHPDLVAKYGWIEKRVAMEALEDPKEVYSAAKKYLTEGQYEDITLEVSAIDLNSLGVDADAIDVLYKVRCISEPHGLDKFFPVCEIDIPLNDPANQKFKLGSEEHVSLTSQTSSSNSSTEQKVAAAPTRNGVIQSIKSGAAAALNDASTGSYVSYGFNEQGKMSELIISNVEGNPDGSYPRDAGLWRWNWQGLAYSSHGYQFDENNLQCAIRNDGTIVANEIYGNYLYGTTVGSGKLVVGNANLETATAAAEMLPENKRGEKDSVISVRDTTPSGNQTIPYIDVCDGEFKFGTINSENARTQYGVIKGAYQILQDSGNTHDGMLLQSPGLIVIDTQDLGIGDTGTGTNISRTKTTDITVDSGNSQIRLMFRNGMLIYAETVQ